MLRTLCEQYRQATSPAAHIYELQLYWKLTHPFNTYNISKVSFKSLSMAFFQIINFRLTIEHIKKIPS